MTPLFYRLATLAQTPAPTHEMSFSDLQKGMRDNLNGQTSDSHYRHILIGVVAAIILLAILLNLRQRRKTGEPPSKPSALFRELSKSIRFPFATRLLLHLLARSAKVPAATLLISRDLFESSLKTWSTQPTFTPLRAWATTRLNRLPPLLFDP